MNLEKATVVSSLNPSNFAVETFEGVNHFAGLLLRLFTSQNALWYGTM